jgi:transposase-like protein
MHTKPIAEIDGKFESAKPSNRRCPKCKKDTVVCQTWESSCGGYDDDKFTCSACGYHWWVEGPDA